MLLRAFIDTSLNPAEHFAAMEMKIISIFEIDSDQLL